MTLYSFGREGFRPLSGIGAIQSKEVKVYAHDGKGEFRLGHLS